MMMEIMQPNKEDTLCDPACGSAGFLAATGECIHDKYPDTGELVSRDIIESLFGNFKHIIERSPQADMNRTMLLIPALCGKLTDTTAIQTLRQASQADIKAWEKKHITYTVRKKRHAFFNGGDSQNTGKYKSA